MGRSWMEGCTPTRHQGIWKTTGGYRVRARAVDPRTGKTRERNAVVAGTLEEALATQLRWREELRAGGAPEPSRTTFRQYAASLTERKIALGELRSPSTRTQWAHVLDAHLLPYFGDWYVDAIRRADVLAWLTEQGKEVQGGRLSPHTANGRLRVLATVLRAAAADLDLRDPTALVKPLDTSMRETYTEEAPNALTAEELPGFLAKARELYPQHYAMLALGFATGRRPSELRGIRRKGETPDVDWRKGVVLIRRSATRGAAHERTKTGRRLRLTLPHELMGVLRWHADRLEPGPMRDSDLLFPGEHGGPQSDTTLQKPMRVIAKAACIRHHISPRAMRRTFQDLTRAAGIEDVVTRAISGHASWEMQDHYSTVAAGEVKAALAKVIPLMGLKGSA